MSVFPFHIVAGKPETHWYLNDKALAKCIQEVAPLIHDSSAIGQENLIKNEKRRLVFKHRFDGIDYLIKAFPLDTLRARLKHRKYADTEAENVLRAGQLGIPVPALHACGYRRESFLTVWNALCYEYIDSPSMETLLEKEPDQQKKIELLQRAFPLFRHFYETGCNHIDFKPGSILLGATGNDVIIDFQYVSFLSEPSARVLASQAGYFAWDVSVRNQWLGPDAMQEWFHSLLQYLGLNSTDDLMSVYNKTARRRYSIRQRLEGSAGQD